MALLRVVLATGNRGKAGEFARLLGSGFDVQPLPAGVQLPEETGSTFAENALLKARDVYGQLGGESAVLADDSGLTVSALGGRPGVWSARFAGDVAGDHANNLKVLAELAGATDRSARFVCCLALVLPEGRVVTAEGTLPGSILEEPRGSGGFGYDPLFQPDGWSDSLAQVAPELKDAVSHRARAVASLLRRLADTQGGET